jgi:ankyrin repeat protein
VHIKLGMGESDPDVSSHIIELLDSETKFKTMVQSRYSLKRGIDQVTPLHVVAGAGLDHTTAILLNDERFRCAISVRDMNGRTAVHEASRNGHFTVVERLLQCLNCNIDARDIEGMTALQLAAECGHTEVIRILLRANTVTTEKDDYGRDALSIALASGEDESARIIFDHILRNNSVDVVSARNAPKQVLLHQIANLGYAEGVSLLLAWGADPFAEDNWGYTPVHLAARKGWAEVVKTLLKAMHNRVPPSYCHHTPLQLAAKHGHEPTVDVLLSTNPEDTNARDILGFTPLHSAAAAGQLYLVRKLVHITEIAIPGECHVPSPFQLAQWGGHQDVLDFLYQHYIGDMAEISLSGLEYSTDALSGIERVMERFCPRAEFPYQLNGICYLSEHYGLMHLKAGRFRVASAWYDIALVTHPCNVGIVDPAAIVNPIKSCDHCGAKPIVGTCYTCTRCIGPCYDLCGSCYVKRSEIHQHERYLTIPASSNPLPSLDGHLTILKDAVKGTVDQSEM